MSDKNQTYDFICFTDLVYEFTDADRVKVEKKIKSRLKYHKFGAYKQERVDYIRQLKNEVCSEISGREKSKYYHKTNSIYSELADFDVEKMTADFHAKYNTVNDDELRSMIDFAIYLYHLR